MLLGLALAAPVAEADPSTTIVISKIMTRGPAGGNDEFIELKNKSTAPVAIGGWQLWGSNVSGSAQSARATITAGTELVAGATYRLTNSQGNQTGGNQTYSTGIADDGGLQLRSTAAAGSVVDAVGSESLTGPGTAFREGSLPNAGLVFPTANGNNAFVRKTDGTQDTDDNDADFEREDSGPGPSCPKDADGFTKITDIQTLGSAANPLCVGPTDIKIRGIVTGIDDLYGSNFDNIFRSDAGLWVQQATRDPAATTSSAIFIAGVRRDAVDPEKVIGSDITITGRIETKFGLVQLVPPGVGTTNQFAQEVDLGAVAIVNSTGNALPPAVTLERAQAENQGVNRAYYRSLQGMRVRLPEGIATGGGTTKYRDVFVEPGTTATRLFRKNEPAAETTPWSDAPAELGVSPDGGAGNPDDPRLPWFSETQVNLDLFDVVRNVVGPLTYSFSFYKVMPQLPVAGINDGEQPAIERGPINAAAPPTAPAQPADSIRVASFNVENLFPVGKSNDGHEITEDEYAERVHAIVEAIRHRLREPDVVAVQEVAVFGDGANALTGLAAALGNYTGYIAPNNDERGIATGFLVKDGTTASNGRLEGEKLGSPWGSSTVCDLHPGPLFDRAPYVIDLRKGDLSFTAMSNHWASQSHETACRDEEAKFVRELTSDLQEAGRNVLVAGDLNDFEFSTPLATLTQGGLLTNLWYDAPAGEAYSYKFNGHLQTLDHIVVTAGLKSRLLDFRYVHFDNDVYERVPTDGTGISDHDPPLATFRAVGASTSTPGDVSGNVPATLALTLGSPAVLGTFVPGVTADYQATMTAQVTSTGADATLSVLDSSNTATGRLVNGQHALQQPLQVRANDGAFAPLRSDNGPLTLLTYNGPVSANNVTLGFKQSIAANEGLRTGTYAKTLTFTLSTSTP
jgi:predicted extracellular nuclease